MISDRSTTIAAALATLAAVQFSLLADGLGTGSARHVTIGDDLSGVRVADEGGEGSLLSEFQLVLVFDPACAHSRQVAARWRAFLQDPDRPPGILALAPGSPEAAARHAEAHHWRVPVGTMGRFRLGSREHVLLSRTPWVIALRDGRVIAQGHGDELPEVVAALSSATGAPRDVRPRLATANLP